jgi:WD40 repeat protein
LPAADNPKDAPKETPLPKGAKTQLGNSQMVFRFAPSATLLPPDYKTLLIPDRGGVRRYELATGRALDKEKGDEVPTDALVAVSGDGKRFVVAGKQFGGDWTSILSVRNTTTGEVIQKFTRADVHSHATALGLSNVCLSADGKVLAQGSQDKDFNGFVTVWGVDKNEKLFHTGVLQREAPLPILSPDGKLLATRAHQVFGGRPPTHEDNHPTRTIQVWDVAARKELFQARVSPGAFLTTVAFSPDAATLAVSGGDGPLVLWDAKTGKPKRTLLGRTGQSVRIAFSPDGKTVAGVGSDGAIQRWAMADGNALGTTEALDPYLDVSVLGLAFAGNDRVVAWGTVGQSTVAWEAPSGKLLTPPTEHVSAIQSIGFAAGGKTVVTSGADGRVVRWDATTGKPLGPVVLRPGRERWPAREQTGPQPQPVVTVSRDGSRAIAYGFPSVVFDLTTGREEFCIPTAQSGRHATSSVPSADLTRVAILSVTTDETGTASCAVWDTTNRRKLAEVEVPYTTRWLPTAGISPSGERLVTAVYERIPPDAEQKLVVTGWDLKTGKKIDHVVDVNASGRLFVAVASDGYAVLSFGSGRMRAYNYADGKGGDEFETTRPGPEVTGPVVFSPDGKQFASAAPADERGTSGVRVHDWPSGRVRHTFVGHRTPVTALGFSPDGKTLASGSQDTTVLLWDVGEKKEAKE